jgi:choline-sulfatase
MGPHAPHTPPEPFNELYHPDIMPERILGDLEVDHMDEQIPWMNHFVWAEEVDEVRSKVLRARYYGEITHIDECIGRLLDAIEERGDAQNTVICFFSDHGEHLGDHHAWQKETFFEASTRVPFILSWPGRVPEGQTCDDLVSLTDLFGIATTAAGAPELRDGVDVIGALEGEAEPRDTLFGYYGTPGTRRFKIMVRRGRWKYIYMANGGREQLFDVAADPDELEEQSGDRPDVRDAMRNAAVERLVSAGVDGTTEAGDLRALSYEEREKERLFYGDPIPRDPEAAYEQVL